MKTIVLSVIICSALHGNCQIPYEKNESYETWADCMRQGYIDSLQIVDLMGDQYVNNNRIFIKFQCEERKIEDSKESAT
tara:strand:+ start:1106 stop:1342 length:237 start_codon:yes stop_codon:yes gene_type:complete